MSLNNKKIKIAVAGTGYVGLSNAVLLSQHNSVYAVDILSEKVDIVAQTDYSNDLDEIREYIYGLEDKLSDIYTKTQKTFNKLQKME